MAATTPYEIEVKLRFDSVEPLMRAGIVLEIETARHFEDNLLLDTDNKLLSQKAAILRVRQSGKTGVLTYKEKAAPDAPATQFKQRIEFETVLDDPATAIAIFERLGYQKWFRYQKYRTVYHATLPGGQSLHVMFDETPIGNFIELEGEEEAIVQAVELLGVRREDYVIDSYLALQAADCARYGKPLEDMVLIDSLGRS
jgi:adenylate cyclase class 2